MTPSQLHKINKLATYYLSNIEQYYARIPHYREKILDVNGTIQKRKLKE
jgi:hypothetical protein